jgi:hypothetical protein
MPAISAESFEDIAAELVPGVGTVRTAQNIDYFLTLFICAFHYTLT